MRKHLLLAGSILCLAPGLVPAAAAADLTFVNVAAPAINCVFHTPCTVVVSDSVGAIAVAPVATGPAVLQTRTFVGVAGTPGAGKTAYEYRVDLTKAVSDGEIPCVTDVAIDFGPNTPLPFAGGATPYDAFVITQGGIGTIGLFNIVRTGHTVDFIFEQPVCAGASLGTGKSSYFFGIASAYAPRAVTANVGWPGTLGLPTAARAPNHLIVLHPPIHVIAPVKPHK